VTCFCLSPDAPRANEQQDATVLCLAVNFTFDRCAFQYVVLQPTLPPSGWRDPYCPYGREGFCAAARAPRTCGGRSRVHKGSERAESDLELLMGMAVGLNPVNTRNRIEHDLGGHCTVAGTLSGWFATELCVPDSFIESLLPGHPVGDAGS
jgi:hypothetical protein